MLEPLSYDNLQLLRPHNLLLSNTATLQSHTLNKQQTEVSQQFKAESN